MRTAKELEAMVVGLIPWAPAPYDLLAIDQAEVDWFTARLKGRHGVKHIGIKLGSPADLEPLVRVIWDDVLVNPKEGVAKTVKTKPVAKWDEDGL